MFIQQTESGRVRLVTSASDLTAASSCEFAFLRRVDARLGRDVVVPDNEDPMLARAGELGDVHEEAELARLRSELGDGIAGEPGGVVSIPRPDSMAEDDLRAVAEQTLRALRGHADIVFQATFFDTEHLTRSTAAGGQDVPEIGFIGFADFLTLGPDGRYEVQDTKLARRAKVTALMQLAAYAEQLERLDVPVSPVATLILGSGERSAHRIADIAPVFRRRRARLHELLLSRYAEVGADGRRESAAAIAWGAEGINACGRCEVCEPEVVRTRDPLLIAGMRPRQRDALRAAGLHTIDAIAAALPAIESGAHPVPGLTRRVLENIAMQAAVQVMAEDGAKVGSAPPFRVIAAEHLSAIPQPNPGDLFFDFEGDPFYRETGDDGVARWNLDYLFGMVDAEEKFTALWAHNLEEEKRALQEFIAFVMKRRCVYPGMHIYHYASYERTHLLSIAARHGVCEKEVDELLRENVLVDLYPIVRRSLRVGSRSYSIKKLEPLYMGDELRDVDGVTDGAQSVVEYAEASAQLASVDAGEQASGQARLDAIADYNRYDCVSTLRLRDWLLGIAREVGVTTYPTEFLAPSENKPVELSEVGAELLELAENEEDPALRTALKLASSAIDYHEREHKSFWWAHFARLTDPIEDWADTRDVLVVEAGDSEVEDDWHVSPRARTERRRVRLRGVLAPGSTFKPGSDAFVVYDLPAPFTATGSAPGARAVKRVKIVERYGDGATIEEPLGTGNTRYAELPIAITPGPPPHAGRQKSAIEAWGRAFATAQAAGRRLNDPVVELLLRAKPRLTAGTGASTDTALVHPNSALVRPDSDEARLTGGSEELRTIGAVVASIRRLDNAALAVQGPPGTGKTYLAARVIRQLVEENRWRIGVVAQSHRVVENVLEGVVAAGLDARLVGKVPQRGSRDLETAKPGFAVLPKDGHAAFLAERATRGAVIGGTAWDFAHEGRIARKSLDLLVIDEAGQFSLAPTIAASVAAKRLLLLGDQQQLPQVSQGAHPEPVDTSALSWLLGEHDTMPDGYGYFLADTRRMHPDLASVVSELSYDGRLKAHPSTLTREVVDSVGPGLHWRGVNHRGDSTHSATEAAAIVETIRDLLAATVHTRDADGNVHGSRQLTEDDIIVVAAYNAQVECILDALNAAGYRRVRVGTVDRFQGQEAVISLVSLAASSADDVPRGLEFLLMRNRLNVAISRAQWAAILFSSTTLGDGLPSSVEGVAALSGYLRLTERG